MANMSAMTSIFPEALKGLKEADPEVFAIIEDEKLRQRYVQGWGCSCVGAWGGGCTSRRVGSAHADGHAWVARACLPATFAQDQHSADAWDWCWLPVQQ